MANNMLGNGEDRGVDLEYEESMVVGEEGEEEREGSRDSVGSEALWMARSIVLDLWVLLLLSAFEQLRFFYLCEKHKLLNIKTVFY